MKKIELSLVLPCYNEAEHFSQSIRFILAELEKNSISYELIFVEDKSSDSTRELLKSVIKISKKNNLKVILHPKNMGRGKSVNDGMMQSSGKYVGFMDIDCEVSPKHIPLFIQKLKEGYDVVCADRKYPISRAGLTRSVASKTYGFLVQLILGIPLTDSEAGYKFFNRNAILPILKKTKSVGWFWDTEIMARSYAEGLKISFLPVPFNRRSDKTSTVRLIPDAIEYLKNLIRFRLQNT